MELIWNYYTKELGITKYKKNILKSSSSKFQVASCKSYKLQVVNCLLKVTN